LKKVFLEKLTVDQLINTALTGAFHLFILWNVEPHWSRVLKIYLQSNQLL